MKMLDAPLEPNVVPVINISTDPDRPIPFKGVYCWYVKSSSVCTLLCDYEYGEFYSVTHEVYSVTK